MDDLTAAHAIPSAGDTGTYIARELWKPTRDEQMAALEILLACAIPGELRRELRAREIELSRSTR